MSLESSRLAESDSEISPGYDVRQKKDAAFDNSVMKAVLPAWAGTTPKRCELPLFLAAIGRAVRR